MISSLAISEVPDMSSFSMNPVCAFSCHVGTVLGVAFVEQQRTLAFSRSYEVDVFIQCTQSMCLCVSV